MNSLGQIALYISLIMSAFGGAVVMAAQKESAKRAGETLLLGAAASCAASLLILAFLLTNHDYRNAYVYSHADSNMGFIYLLCAVWGGQEGSLLFWSALQTFFTAAVILLKKDKNSLAVGILAAFQIYFISLVILHSNPFELSGRSAVSGMGMNPLLLNPFMAVHPPTLFLGFAGFSVPCAFALSALTEKKYRADWPAQERNWILFAWLFLGIGNIFGMVWAYEELGWGGYWGWDPVENASFLPWLTSTALLHIATSKKADRYFGVYSAFLPVLTFCLIIFGTYITRSGVIQSVHAFAETTVSPYFLGLIVFLILVTTALIAFKKRELVTEEEFKGFFSRENLLRITVWILLLSTMFVWLGTMMPLFTELFKGEKVASTPEFFNRWMVPLGLALLGTLGVCLAFSKTKETEASEGQKVRSILTTILIPFVFGTVLSLGAAARFGLQGIAPSIAFLLIGFSSVAVTKKIIRIYTKSSGNQASRLFRRRRLGAHIVHAATVVMFLGFTGAAYTEETSAVLNPGEIMEAGDYRLMFMGLRDDNNYRRYAVFADLEVASSNKSRGVLSPARFFYHSHPNQPTSEVAIYWNLSADLFVAMGNIDENTSAVTIRVIVNPLVSFIWIGGVLLIIGVLIGLFSKFRTDCTIDTAVHTKRIVYVGSVLIVLAASSVLGFLTEPQYSFLLLIGIALLTMILFLSRAVSLGMGNKIS